MIFVLKDVTCDFDSPADVLKHGFKEIPPFCFVELNDVILRASYDPSLVEGCVMTPSWVYERLRNAVEMKTLLFEKKSKKKFQVLVRPERDDIPVVILERSLLHRRNSFPLDQLREGHVFGVAFCGEIQAVRVVGIVEKEGQEWIVVPPTKEVRSEVSAEGECLLSCFGEVLLPRLAHSNARLLVIADAGMMSLSLVLAVTKELKLSALVLSSVFDLPKTLEAGKVYIVEGLQRMSKDEMRAITSWMASSSEGRIVVLTSERKKQLTLSRFGIPITIHAPNREQRTKLLTLYCGEQREDFDSIVDVTGGFSVLDLKRLCKHALRQTEGAHVVEKLLIARKVVEPSLLQQIFSRTEPQKVQWEDVVGCDHVKGALESTVLWPLKNERRLAMMNSSGEGGGGLLLYGPTGCGKTMSVHAFACMAQVNFIQVEAVHLLSKYTGETEENVRKVFSQAR